MLQKIGSVDSFATWAELKDALRQHIRPLSSFSAAQESINTNKQKKTENVRAFGARMKTMLEEVNNTQNILDSTQDVRNALRKQNVTQAITKLQQNVYNTELQRQIASFQATSFDGMLAYAAEREIWLKASSLLKCSICKNKHFEFDCTVEEGKNKNSGDSERSNGKRDVICARCKRPGHVAANCYSKIFQPRNGQNGNGNNNNNNNNNNRQTNRYANGYAGSNNNNSYGNNRNNYQNKGFNGNNNRFKNRNFGSNFGANFNGNASQFAQSGQSHNFQGPSSQFVANRPFAPQNSFPGNGNFMPRNDGSKHMQAIGSEQKNQVAQGQFDGLALPFQMS